MRCSAAATAVALALGLSGPVVADTPPDILVMAYSIDDMISLDPAEIFEFTAAEYAGNTYDRLVGYDPDDVSRIFGVAAESWDFGDDGRTYTFRMREGVRFPSGNSMTAEDAAFSIRRAIMLNKSPAFILTQFGLTPENVTDRVRATDKRTLVLKTDKEYAPTFVLYCLTATIGSVVDRQLALSHEQDGDMGYNWLKTNYAGVGPFKLRRWKPNESLTLDRNDGYWQGAPAMKRVVIRHVAEGGAQRLLLEKGDIDIARNLGADQITDLAGHADIRFDSGVKGAIYYMGLSQKHPALANPKVRQAMKYLVDYAGISNTILKGKSAVHQAFLPKGFLGALEDTPYGLNVPLAKALLADAGYPDGFTVTMDTRDATPVPEIAQAIQGTMAQAGIRLDLVMGTNKQTLTKYRARNHDIYIGRWGPDYQDPHTNADTFARNPDNADDARSKPLAWRNSWDIPGMTKAADAAVLERDPARRAAIYRDIQRLHQATSPFIIMFQDTEVIGFRKGVEGFVIGPAFDDNRYAGVTKP